MSSYVRGFQRDLEDVAAMLQKRLDLEDLGSGVYVDATQVQLRVGERPTDRLGQVSLIDAKLSDRPPHAHLGAHELRGGVDPQTHPDPAPLPLPYSGGPGEHDILRLEPRGPRHHELAGRGDLGAGLPLRGYELTHGEVGVRLEGEGDLRPDGLPHAADPLHDHLPVVEVEGRAVLFRYPGDGHPAGGELPITLTTKACG